MTSSVTSTYDPATGIGRVVLDDADAGNPLHTESARELGEAVRSILREGARVLVLSSTGRFFSVGGDLAGFASASAPQNYIDDLADTLHRTVSDLTRSPTLVVSAVQGPAAGAGFPLAAAADIVVAARSASFTPAYTKVGLSPDGGTTLLVHTLGLHRTLRLALLNDRLSADEAYAAGLVARVVDDADLATTVEDIATTLAAGAARAQGRAKQLVRAAAEESPESRLRAEAQHIAAQAADPEGREGIAAFVAKRSPRFHGDA